MSLDFNTNHPLVRKNKRSVKRAELKSYSIDSLEKKIKELQANASSGNYQAQLRLEAISQLLDPCLHFYESDVQRILNKGYSIQVERGLQLYRMMSRLQLFCEPIGNKVGVACPVRLINFEELTLDKLLDIKGQAFNLVFRWEDRNNADDFNGLALLSVEEQTLYWRLKPYFGNRKRPTLKSLAVSLLGERKKVFSERNALNYLRAVRDFKNKHKNDLGYRWYFMESVELYNRHAKTGREMTKEIIQSFQNTPVAAMIPSIGIDFAEIARAAREQVTSAVEGFKIMADSMKGIADDHKQMLESIAKIAYMPPINFAEVFPLSNIGNFQQIGPRFK